MNENRERIAGWICLTALAVLFLVALDGPFGSLDNFRVPIGVLAFSAWVGRRRTYPVMRRALTASWFIPWLTVFVAVVFVRLKWLEFYSGRISGVDFSHIDYGVWSTVHGRFMQIPFLVPQATFTDFFGNHYSPILFFHVAFRALWDSPLSGLTLHALSLAAAIPVLHAVAKQWVDDLTAALLTLLFVLCGATASTLQFDLHQESFYPLSLGLLWLSLRGPKWTGWAGWVGLILALSIKEDTGLYLAPFLLLCAWKFPAKRIPLVGQAVLSLAWLIFAVKVAMPWHQPPHNSAPFYMGFWAKYGTNFHDVALSMAVHPHWVAQDLFLNIALYKNLLPWLFLPLGSVFVLGALAPAVVAATGSASPHVFGLYYGMILVPFFFLAAADRLSRIALPRRHALAVCMVLVGSLVGGSYLRFFNPSAQAAEWESAESVINQSLGDQGMVVVQSGLLPHLSYSTRWRRFDDFPTLPPADGHLGVVLFDGVENGFMTEPRSNWEHLLEQKGYRKFETHGNLTIYK